MTSPDPQPGQPYPGPIEPGPSPRSGPPDGHGPAPAYAPSPSYGPPPGAAPSYGPPPGAAPSYGPPPGAAPGYGPPPGAAPGYGPPPSAAPGYGPAPGYGFAPGYGPMQGYGAPGYPAGGVAFAPVVEYTRPGGRELAVATDRLIARIIDAVIINLPILLIEIPLAVWLGLWFIDRFELNQSASTDPNEPPPVDGGDVLLFMGLFFALIVGVTLLSALITYLYDVVYMHRRGQTIGKRVMKIRVVRVEDGGPIELRHARRRWMAQDGMVLLTLIPLVGSFVGIYNWIDSLWLLWDKPNRQCLHDKYGKTAVVKLTATDLEAAA